MTITTRIPIMTLTITLLCTHAPQGMAQSKDPLDQSKENMRLWLETSQKRQAEENSWKADQEILSNYKEGLLTEKAAYQKQIEEAKQRAQAADQQSSDKINQRDQLIAAEKALASHLRSLEEEFAKQIPFLPTPLLKMPKMAVGIETLKKNLSQPADQQSDDVGKRSANLTEMIAEVEKFQQNITVSNELHKNAAGQEYNMQVVYLGIAAAYAVNEDASFALVGSPKPDGWKFNERNEIAADIKKLIITATTEKDISFTTLPVPTP
jgi:DNA anti-recombination protein RmuC